MLKSNLEELLNERGLSIREFARRIDYRFESVRLLYNNEMARIPTELIERCCRELDCSISELFSIVDEK